MHVARPITVSGAPTPFGVQDYESLLEEEGGGSDTQAGSHPYQFTTALDFNQLPFYNVEDSPLFAEAEPAQLEKNLTFALPPGLIGNPSPFQKCTLAQFLTILNNHGNLCPTSSQVGVSALVFNEPDVIGLRHESQPLFELDPEVGEPARFGFILDQTPVFIDTSVRSGADYGITAHVDNITQTVGTYMSVTTFWGVPGEASHNSARGWGCFSEQHACATAPEGSSPALFTLPTSCNGELSFPLEGDSWLGWNERQAQGLPEQLQPLATATGPAINGCNREPFDPSIKATPDGSAASSSSGLNVDVHVPQESILYAGGVAQSAVKDISVTLPQGVQINPAGAGGLQTCSEGLVGFGVQEEGKYTEFTEYEPGVKTARFTPRLPGSVDALAAGETAAFEPGVNFCSSASKVGEVTIHTPLLPATQPLKGFVYIATQNANPFGSLIAMYIVAEDPVSGAVFKAAGEVHLTESGQIVTTFKNTPELAFEDADLHFFGGERAPLATPARCGSYTTEATFTPWSGNEPVNSSSTFNITSGPGGSSCTYPGQALPFKPSLTGGVLNINAGGFSPLTTTIGREDGEQNMSRVQLHFPPGLSGLLSSVKLCPEQQANEGACGPESLIGETTVAAGVGSDPVSVKGGKVYITETYHGAPFGLSIVNPVKAGPFDLEHDTSPADPGYTPACDCVVVRAKIEIDPYTTALTVTTNSESEGHAIPHLIDGIPVQIKKVNVLIDRPGFTFNPTNCAKTEITGSIGSDEGASSPVSVPFQVTNCAALKFEPKFSVSTSGKTSKADGASLTAKVTYPNVPQGTDADIAKVKVELPKQLPSRLTTLQKACTAVQFDTNPANCPSASKIGYAVVHTPLIPVPLEGPAIFVSHGGEAFPSLTMVLQGYGITIDLVGTTFISKSGITSTTFKTVPDQPFSSFTLTLPEGKYSALTALGNVCKEKLTMPTEFIGQNGAEIHEVTPIGVTGCKPAITVTSKKVKGKTATLVVSVPAAGKLVASGKGLSKGTGKAAKAGNVTVKVTLTKGEAAFLSKHHGRKLKATIKLQFTPKQGGRLRTSVAVLIG